jgi:hypothetical protein
VALYQVYFLRPDGTVLRTFELECAEDQAALSKATRRRGAVEVEIEMWERTRFVGWIAVPPFPRKVSTWQKAARLIILLANERRSRCSRHDRD